MPRFTPARTIAVLSLALVLGACSRGQTTQGLGLGGAGAGSGADGESGPITPGSAREFSSRVGDTVYFDTDSVTLSPEAQQTLAAQAQWLNQYPQYRILLEGHADERGTREYNIGLGVQRAGASKQFLATRGIDPRRVRTVSFGKERPVSVCADISCWSKNRRAVTVLDTGGAVAQGR